MILLDMIGRSNEREPSTSWNWMAVDGYQERGQKFGVNAIILKSINVVRATL